MSLKNPLNFRTLTQPGSSDKATLHFIHLLTTVSHSQMYQYVAMNWCNVTVTPLFPETRAIRASRTSSSWFPRRWASSCGYGAPRSPRCLSAWSPVLQWAFSQSTWVGNTWILGMLGMPLVLPWGSSIACVYHSVNFLEGKTQLA